MSAQEHQLRIDSLASGSGAGVGRIDGKICFVPYAAPGDELTVRVVSRSRRHQAGEIVEILSPGPDRRAPRCPLHGRCGGCQWLHVEEAAQLVAKRGFLSRALLEEVVEIAPSPSSLGYRRVARLHFDHRSGHLGFIGADRGGPIDLVHCPVLEVALDETLGSIRSTLLPALQHPVELRLAAGEDGVVVALVSDRAVDAAVYEAAREMIGGRIRGVAISAEGVEGAAAGETLLHSRGFDDRVLAEPASAFGQANRAVNLALTRTVAEWIEAGGYSSAIELYAGAGNLSLAVAGGVGSLVAVERDPAACRAARDNARERGLEKVTVREGDAVAGYEELGARKEVVILDPPRAGSRELAGKIAGGRQRAVLYVSCNPSTLARDLIELRGGGFQITRARGFDMFPQTPHMEAAVLLER